LTIINQFIHQVCRHQHLDHIQTGNIIKQKHMDQMEESFQQFL